MLFDYDDRSIESIENYARKSIGKKFTDFFSVPEDKKIDKGIVGNMFQEHYFGIKRNPSNEPDFKNAHLELKVFGYTLNKNNLISADQRLALTSIDFFEFENIIPFEESHLYKKCKNMLFVVFLLEANSPREESIIKYIRVYKFDELFKKDAKQIISDYNYINKKISTGNAATLSETDTEFLAVSRGGDKNSKLQKAPGNVEVLPRRFSLKQSYMTYLLREYISQEIPFSQEIKKTKNNLDIKINKNLSFEEWLTKKEKDYLNKSVKKIARRKKIAEITGTINWDNNDAFFNLACAMLGIKSNAAPYLKKTNTKIKAIRISKSENIEQNISFPAFSFSEFSNIENWFESQVYNYFSETRFVFMIFKEVKNDYFYIGHYILSLTDEELEKFLKPLWESIQYEINKGVHFKLYINKNGKPKIYNSLPDKKNQALSHVRPHTRKSTYKIKRENIIGYDSIAEKYIEEHTRENYFYLNEEYLKKYGDTLPNGDIMTKQCFWINRQYILSRLEEVFSSFISKEVK